MSSAKWRLFCLGLRVLMEVNITHNPYIINIYASWKHVITCVWSICPINTRLNGPTFHHMYGKMVHNTLRPRQHGRHFPDDIFRCIFLNENIWIAINISLSFIPKGPIDNIPALVQIMAWRRTGDKPLSEPMMVSLLTHICVTRPQWDNIYDPIYVWVLFY